MSGATPFTRQVGIALPIIGGAMYPCSNPELVAAVSQTGAIGIVQPISLTYVYGHEFRAGLRYIRSLTDKPIGMNALIEQSSKSYREKMAHWIDIALEEGVRFFITSLGKPAWVVERVRNYGGIVYHDVTERRWAQKAVDAGVHGLIAVNQRAGGHAGTKSAAALIEELRDFNLPVICAGGIGDERAFAEALKLGYAGVQIGTRLIATTECRAPDSYKHAIVDADESDIVLSERITGVPLAVIRTPYVERIGTKAGAIARWMLKGKRTKHLMRMIYALKSLHHFKRSSLREATPKDYWQAGKSVAGIQAIEPVATVIERFARATK